MKTENKNKKEKPRKPAKKAMKSEVEIEMTIDQIKAEMEITTQNLNQCKIEIEKVTDVIISDLLKLSEYR